MKPQIIYDHEKEKPLFGYKVTAKREIASLTKLVSLYTALCSMSEVGVSARDHQCMVSKYSSTIIGTTANLKSGDVLTLNDMFYGKRRIIESYDASFWK